MSRATTMSSSALAHSSSVDGQGDTTLFIATAASYASDGPTLPIIGGVGEHADWDAPVAKDRAGEDARPAKKRKMNDGVAKDAPKVDLGPLYKPWTLLPAEVLAKLEKRLGHNRSWEENCVPVVFTKNQNVKSGINRLKALLGFEGDVGSPQNMNAKSKSKDILIAVSAHGIGTTKLVGIVETTKRIVASKEDEKEEPWYMYTSLTGLVLKQRQEKGSGDTREDQDDTAVREEVRRTGDSRDASEKDDKSSRTPVLTTWLSRKSIPELKTAFGEQTFNVWHKSDGD